MEKAKKTVEQMAKEANERSRWLKRLMEGAELAKIAVFL